jgi:hypothetical protein
MAKSQPGDVSMNTIDNSATKSVLVCFGERKREVSFTYQASSHQEQLEAVGVAVREVYSDVLKGEEELILQDKREEWDGEFTDLCGPVPDRAVLLAVVAGPSKEVSK